MSKKVVFIGGGAASLTSAVLLKKEEPSFDVIIVEKDKKLGKKLSATGGGKCNVAPLKDNPYVYNPAAIELVENLFEEIPLHEYLNILESIGLDTKAIKDYGFYPIHESAPQVVKNLYHQINKLGIKVIFDEFIDYSKKDDRVLIELKDQFIEADKMVIATGGLSEDMRHVFESHGVITTKTHPGLCPVKVKEDVSSLFGCRFEAVITLLYRKNIVRQTYGEVQFKKDGLSGIPVLNLSSLISREEDFKSGDYQISVGLPDNFEINILGKTIEEALFMLFKEEYVNYLIEKHKLDRKELIDLSKEKELLSIVHSERFTVDSLYEMKDAQVTIGGVSLGEIDQNFALNNDKNIYVVGEVLDVDGICGGYNLRFAITSGFKVIKTILND